MTKQFQLHQQLRQDCIDMGRLCLSRLLMMNDSLYPWFILVPEIDDVTEIYQLNKPEQLQLTEESCFLAENLAALYQADKMNIAAIGNLVPQLHIHHIVRYRTDKAWPVPVWGKYDHIPYTADQIDDHIIRVKNQLKDHLG